MLLVLFNFLYGAVGMSCKTNAKAEPLVKYQVKVSLFLEKAVIS